MQADLGPAPTRVDERGVSFSSAAVGESICLFCSYSSEPGLANYVKYYLGELSKNFDRVLLLTNADRELSDDFRAFCKDFGVEVRQYPNEGYDFGMWYRALASLNVASLSSIALVNDSCLLFRSLGDVMAWWASSPFDYAGMFESRFVVHHAQSFFVLLRGKAIVHMWDYFRANGICKGNMQEVIEIYECRLSEYMSSMGVLIGSYATHVLGDAVAGSTNPAFSHAYQGMRAGVPIVKRRLLTGLLKELELSHLLRNRAYKRPADYIDLVKTVNPGLDVAWLLEGAESDSMELGWTKRLYLKVKYMARNALFRR